MIDLYSFGTPNGQKAAIMLEEVGLEYKLHKINILEGDQDTDEYNVERWFNAINDRPAVKKALEVLKDDTGKTKMDDKARDILFGKAQFAQR